MRRALALCAALCTTVAAQESAGGDLRACRDLADPAQRLACYDALPLPEPAVAPEERFGNAAARQSDEPESMQARLAGPFKGWTRTTVFRLDNGQVWKVAGDGEAYFPGVPDNPAVTIRRNWFGAYWMKIEGVSLPVKVRRVS